MSQVVTEGTSVKTSEIVNVPIERAFDVFTNGINTWWNPSHHLIEGEFESMEFEPFEGGHIIDRNTEGKEDRWARVLAYDPPHRVVFSWDISLQWQRETDPEKCSEIEVRFTEQGPDSTLVELEHRNLERHGEGWESMRDAVGSPDGWNLQGFARAAEAAAA